MSINYAKYASEYAWMIGFLSVVLYLINWYRRPKHLPPGPRGLPVVGYLPFLGKRPEKTAYNLSEKYGKIMTIRMGTEDAVFLNDYESIHKVSIIEKSSFFTRITYCYKVSIGLYKMYY